MGVKSSGKPGSPAPSEIREARLARRLTQSEAAQLIHSSMRAWQEWEAGNRKMHPAFWELFQRKANQ